MTADELYKHLTKEESAETVLHRVLEGAVMDTYSRMRFPEGSTPVHPTILISTAALELGWHAIIDKADGKVDGLVVGTMDYIKKIQDAKKS